MATCAAMRLHTSLGNSAGTTTYTAGNLTGVAAAALTGNVTGIRIVGTTAATFDINGGDTETIAVGELWVENPVPGTLVDPTLNALTGTIHYFIEHLT